MSVPYARRDRECHHVMRSERRSRVRWASPTFLCAKQLRKRWAVPTLPDSRGACRHELGPAVRLCP